MKILLLEVPKNHCLRIPVINPPPLISIRNTVSYQKKNDINSVKKGKKAKKLSSSLFNKYNVFKGLGLGKQNYLITK